MPVMSRPRPRWQAVLAATAFEPKPDRNRYVPQSQFPRCELHSINIVDRLPRRCPLGTANPLATIEELSAIGWSAVGRGVDGLDAAEGLEVLSRTAICTDCLDRMLSNRTVRRIRSGLGVTP